MLFIVFENEYSLILQLLFFYLHSFNLFTRKIFIFSGISSHLALFRHVTIRRFVIARGIRTNWRIRIFFISYAIRTN